jgi:hypothetical protein
MTDDREQSLHRRRAWAQSGRDMLERSIASGRRARPEQAHVFSRATISAKARGDFVRHAHKLAALRKGKRRKVAHVQAQHVARSKSVSLPRLSFMEPGE